MRILREIAYWFVVLTGLTWVAARLNRTKILVLAYHGLYDGVPDSVRNFDGLRVRVDRFERQMRYLAAYYHVVPLDALRAAQTSPRCGKPLAAITLDDGDESVYRHAVPVLRRLGLPATVFVITDHLLHERAPWWTRLRATIAATRCQSVQAPVQGRERWFRLATAGDKRAALRQLSPELQRLPSERREALLARLAADLRVEWGEWVQCQPLTAAQLREMADRCIEVGSHGCSHDSFLHLSWGGLVAELTESKQVLESVTGRPVGWLCYPYGDFSREAVEAARGTGYRGAVTTIEGLNNGIPDPYTVRRIGVNDHLSFAHFIVAVSGLRDLLKGLLRIGGAGRAGAVPVPSGLLKG